jgi:hypothetical protein
MLNLNDILGFLQNYSSSVPMNQTATAGYGLAKTGLDNQFSLGNKSLDLSANQFNDSLALQKMKDLWSQQFAEKQFGAGQNQQTFENSLATKQANLYSDPVYQNFLKLTNPETIRGEQTRATAAQADAMDSLNQMQAARTARQVSATPWWNRKGANLLTAPEW